MANVLLFHHALGLTDGIQALADSLQSAGHAVWVPDLYDGATYKTIDEGVAHAEGVGFDSIIERGAACADTLPQPLVVVGISLGILPAQKLAQTSTGVAGAILIDGGVPASTFGEWRAGVELQMHFCADDEWAEPENAERLAQDAGGELFVYPGSAHLVIDSSFADHDPDIAALILKRMLGALARW